MKTLKAKRRIFPGWQSRVFFVVFLAITALFVFTCLGDKLSYLFYTFLNVRPPFYRDTLGIPILAQVAVLLLWILSYYIFLYISKNSEIKGVLQRIYRSIKVIEQGDDINICFRKDDEFFSLAYAFNYMSKSRKAEKEHTSLELLMLIDRIEDLKFKSPKTLAGNFQTVLNSLKKLS
ncbi:MAG: hypothetical protein KAI43_12050 [Candidatus Aureabacteria bacterium]|nr:hypothetical protein [Candidatus Auribacterota bacterium]